MSLYSYCFGWAILTERLADGIVKPLQVMNEVSLSPFWGVLEAEECRLRCIGAGVHTSQS